MHESSAPPPSQRLDLTSRQQNHQKPKDGSSSKARPIINFQASLHAPDTMATHPDTPARITPAAPTQWTSYRRGRQLQSPVSVGRSPDSQAGLRDVTFRFASGGRHWPNSYWQVIANRGNTRPLPISGSLNRHNLYRRPPYLQNLSAFTPQHPTLWLGTVRSNLDFLRRINFTSVSCPS